MSCTQLAVRRYTVSCLSVLAALLVLLLSAVAAQSMEDATVSASGAEMGAAAAQRDVFQAVREGDLQFVDQFIAQQIDSGFSANVQNQNGWTPAIFAVEANQPTILAKLVEEGKADVNIAENDGWTPLMFAAYHGNYPIAEQLLRYGANAMQRNAQSVLPHTLARAQGHHELSGLLLTRALVQAMEVPNYSAADLVLDLLRDGANPNTQNARGWHPLMFSAALNKPAEVSEILALGADTNLAENDGWTALMFAANNNFLEVAQLLLDRRADTQHVSVNGASPVGLAADRGFQPMLELLGRYAPTPAATEDSWDAQTNTVEEVAPPTKEEKPEPPAKEEKKKGWSLWR